MLGIHVLNMRRLLATAFCMLVFACSTAFADDSLINIDTRPGVSLSYWWMPREGAKATVLLFSGGEGGIGYRDGKPQSNNFLIRSRDEFAKAGFSVALLGNPSDARRITPSFRQSAEHIVDVRATLEQIRKSSNAPIWLVGTSQGTISAAAAAIALGDAVQGLVLTATLSGQQFGGSVSGLALDKLKVPTLVYQHARDACKITPAYLAQALLPKMTQAPVKKYLEVDGGSEPTGNPCEALHYHGFINMEARAVQDIASWILAPSP